MAFEKDFGMGKVESEDYPIWMKTSCLEAFLLMGLGSEKTAEKVFGSVENQEDVLAILKSYCLLESDCGSYKNGYKYGERIYDVTKRDIDEFVNEYPNGCRAYSITAFRQLLLVDRSFELFVIEKARTMPIESELELEG